VNRITSILVVIFMIMSIIVVSPAMRVSAEETISSYILTTEIGNSGEISFPADSVSNVSVFSDSKGEEVLIWDSPLDPDKPLDIDNVYLSHDNKYIHVRITFGKKINDDENLDPFISIGIDTDNNPATGMSKLNERSYNMGGEDFFARFSTGHGYKKFILDAWDSSLGDTVETGGLGNGIAGDKEIQFSIPRRAIGNPSSLDFKIVGRMYQATDPDLSPDHLTYNLLSEKTAIGVTAQIQDGNCILKTTPKNIPGIHQYHVKLDSKIISVMHYVRGGMGSSSGWNLHYTADPVMNTRLNIARIQTKTDDEKIWFKIDFWDGLEHMGGYDYKIWVMCDTGSGGNFKGERFCDGSQNFIMEVSTESGRTTSKLYVASKGMGYNQRHLTDVELDSSLGSVIFSCKLSRIGNPEKIEMKVAGGGWKAPEKYWDNTDEFVVTPKTVSDELVYKEVTNDGVDAVAFDIGKIFCAHNKESLKFKIGLVNHLDEQTESGFSHLLINSDLDNSTGIPASSINPGGEDYFINIELGVDKVSGELSKLSSFTEPVFVSDVEVSWEDSILSISINLEDLENPDGIIFLMNTFYPPLPGLEDETEWNLKYSLTGEEIPEACNVFVSNLGVIEGDGQVKLIWKSTPEEISGFNIYRAKVGETFTKLTDTPLPKTQTEYIDKTATNNETYRYYIKAICIGGAEGLKSETITAKPKGIFKTPIIHITPENLDLGSRIKPLGHTETFKIKNEGPVVFNGNIQSNADWLAVSPFEVSVGIGESVEIKVEVTKNLIAGIYNGNISITGSGIFRSVKAKLNVPKSSPQTKFVRSLIAEPFTLAVRLKWNPPSYNHEKLLKYKIIRTEVYRGKRIDEEIIFEVSLDTSFLMDSGLDSESKYTYSVAPVYPSGSGVPRIVSATPVPPFVWISMGIGLTEAIVDGEIKTLDVAPFIISGRTVVPFRFIGEALRAEVSYEAETRTAIFTRGRRVVRIPIGGNTATIDGEEVKIDPPAIIKNGRTLVPLRFVSEAFSAEVEWDGDTRTIDIYYPKNYRPDGWEPKP